MKKAELLLAAAVLIFLCCNFNYAQVTKETYDKAVDFFNCKVVEKSLDETVRSSTETDKPKDQQIYDRFQTETQTCQNADYNGIRQFFEPDIYPRTKKLSTEINLLKQKYNEAKTADELVTFITDESFRDNAMYPLLVAFANKPRKGSDFADFKKELKSSLKNIIGSNEQPIKPPDNSDTSNINGGTIAPSPVQDSKLPVFLAILALAVSAAVFVMFIIEKLSSPNESGRHSNNPEKDNTKKILGEHKSELIDLSNSTNSLITRVKQLEKELNQLKLSITLDNDAKEKDKKQENPKVKETGAFEKTSTTDSAGSTYNLQPQQIETQSPKEVFYLPTPSQDKGFNDNGCFDDAARHSTFTAGKTIYKFSKLSGNKAEFEIDSRDDSVRLALSYPDRNISPVCEIETSSGNKSRIINVQAGEAVLDDQKWKVTKKAVIRYE